MNSGVLVRTDRATYERWARALSGLALPGELLPGVLPARATPPDRPALSLTTASRAAAAGFPPTSTPTTPVPPVVAASLALHGCAEVAVTVRVTMPDTDLFGCFGLVSDLAAGLVRNGAHVEIGLFRVDELVEQVTGLVPARPPSPGDAGTGCVRITVMGADAAAAGWQQVLVSGETHWQRADSGPTGPGPVLVPDVRGQLAADLRFALADCLTGADDA